MTSDYSHPVAQLPEGSMPLLGFGTWQIPDADVEDAVTIALESGYRHIDTATMYRNEAGIGRALAATPVPRDELFVTTKLPPDRAGRARATLEESLTKLGLDHVDLWLIHWPPAASGAVALWKEFVRAREDGLTRSIGVSNFSLAEIDELTDATGTVPAVNQVRWAPALYDAEFVAGMHERGVVLEGYSPFKLSDLDDPTFVSIAAAHDATPAQVIVAWHAAHGFVVIPKSARRERIESNAAGIEIALTPEEITAIDGLAG